MNPHNDNQPPHDYSDDAREIVPPPVDARVADELAFHIEMRTRELIAQGIDPDDARRQATERFGNFREVSGELRRIARKTDSDRRRTRYMSELAQDARFALRMLSRRRVFATIAVGTLAIGIGAATAIYSVADSVLLRPLPFSEPDRIAAVWLTQPSTANDPTISWLATATPMGNREYQELGRNAHTIRDLSMYMSDISIQRTDAGPERVRTNWITSTVLNTLRAQPALGRAFNNTDDVLNGPRVAILSWENWHSHFGADSAVIGKSTTLNDQPYTIVGVMPEGFRLDRTNEPPAYWLPALQDSSDIPQRRNLNYRAIARLAPNTTFEAAAIEVRQIIRGVEGDSAFGTRVEQWQRDQSRNARGPLLILLGAVGLLLLIACVNVAILQLGEAAGRAREIAARAALGAGTGRLVRQLLVESGVIAFVSALLGTAFAWAMIKGLIAIAPEKLPGMDAVSVDARVLAFALACAMLTGMLFGIVPALIAGRAGASSLVRTGSSHSGRNTRRIQRFMIATQLALSMVLLVEATLFARSLGKLTSIDPGFVPTRLMAARISFSTMFDDDVLRTFTSEVIRRLEGGPGIEQVTATSQVPFATGYSSSPVTVEPLPGEQQKKGQHMQQRYVLPAYFDMLGIRPIAGRTFTAQDRVGSELVAVVTPATIKRDFDGKSPIGRMVKQQNKWRRVVGVVPDVKYQGLSKDDEPTIYLPFEQDPNAWPVFLIRTSNEASIAPMLKTVLREIDSRAVLVETVSVPRAIAKSYAAERYRTILITVFASFAALLAAVGMYGVSVRSASRRLREIAIRLALGSTSGSVARLLVGDAMIGVVAGLVLGVPGALLLGRTVTPYLYKVSPSDPVSFVIVFALLAGATAVASFLPARVASRSSAAAVLRSD